MSLTIQSYVEYVFNDTKKGHSTAPSEDTTMPRLLSSNVARNLIAASMYDKHSGGPYIRPICTKCWFTMTSMIQVYSNFIDLKHFLYIIIRMKSQS